jgi:hypothetical protein
MQLLTLAVKLPHSNKFILFMAVLLSGCAQFTTDDEELAALKITSDKYADAYVSCVTKEAEQYLMNSADAAFIVDVARNNCKPALDSYTEAESEFLDAQYMVYQSKLDESVASLDKRSRDEVSLMVLTRGQPQAVSAAPAATVSAGAGSTVQAAAPAAAVGVPAAGWTSEQRVYLDCMEDQAHKYASLDEGAPTIAEVAQSRCQSYMRGSDPALQQEGRSLVMGIVFDARVPPDRLQ